MSFKDETLDETSVLQRISFCSIMMKCVECRLIVIVIVKADFLKAVRKAVPKRLIRLLKGCYI